MLIFYLLEIQCQANPKELIELLSIDQLTTLPDELLKDSQDDWKL